MNTSVRALLTHYIAVPEEDTLHDILEMESFLDGENNDPHFLNIQNVEEDEDEVHPECSIQFNSFSCLIKVNSFKLL